MTPDLQRSTLCDDGWVRFEFGEFQLDDALYTLVGPAGPVHIEPQVFQVLRHLIVNCDRVVSKEELLDSIWGDRFVSESALTSRVKAARRAVGDDGQTQRVIKTVHGRGYHFVAEVHTDAGRIQHALPRLRNTPIGRDGDITSVVERIRAAPLVTITGSGGMGKTTVALAVAERVQAEYADGVVFVDPGDQPGTTRCRGRARLAARSPPRGGADAVRRARPSRRTEGALGSGGRGGGRALPPARRRSAGARAGGRSAAPVRSR